MIPMPPNPFQPEQSTDPMNALTTKHLRIYEDDGKLRVQPIEEPPGFPITQHGQLVHLTRQSLYVFIHVDIDTDEAQKQAIAKRVTSMYFQYMNPDMQE